MEKELCFQDLNLSVSQVIEAMGYRGGHTPSEEVVAKTEFLMHNVTFKCVPIYNYQIYDGRCETDSLHIHSTVFGTGKIIAHSLKNSTHFAIFIASAGILFQRWSEESGDMVDRYILDCIGSEIAERTADKMQETLETEAGQKGYKITNRYSPGYCGWDVVEQHQLFPLLGNETCGVQLTDSGLMYPIKSVSGIIGLGTEVKRKEYGCALCNYPRCFRRKTSSELSQV